MPNVEVGENFAYCLAQVKTRFTLVRSGDDLRAKRRISYSLMSTASTRNEMEHPSVEPRVVM